jgi:hypothetical protein
LRAFVALLSAFLGTIWFATRLYPGGTWFDASSPGFSFWGNFWCDLLHPVSFNGLPNERGMWCAKLAFGLFAAALFRFWPLAARLSECAQVRRSTEAFGIAGALILLLVTLFSSRSDPLLHAVFVVLSSLLGVLAASVLSLALFRTSNWLMRGVSLLMIGSALLNLAQYVRQSWGAEPARWLAGTQKLTTVLLIGFMLQCAWLFYRAAARA